MDKHLSILIIEDSESDAGLVIREFHKANYEITAERVETADGMRSALARQSWDFIISDYNLPEFDAPAALAIFRESGLDIPFIVVSGAIGEEIAVAIMIAGAHDYVMKKNLARLVPAVERELVEAQVRRSKRQAEEAFRVSEEKCRRMIETSQEGIVIVDENFNFTFVNARFVEMLGYSPEELIGKDPLYIIFEEDMPEFLEKRKERIQGVSQQYERRFRRKDGSVLWTHASITAVMDGIGQFRGAFAMYADITQRKQAEEALNRSTEKLRRNLAGTIQAMSKMVEIRDPYTSGHQSRVSNLARSIAQKMGLPADVIDNIRMAGTIHDIGKMAVPVEILVKPTRLTELEMDLIKVHPEAGREILKNADLPYPVDQIVLQHHERLDGSGYPQGLKNGQILLESQIISVADVVEAIASNRPYRPAFGIGLALEEIEQKKGLFYGPEAVDACLRLFREKEFMFE